MNTAQKIETQNTNIQSEKIPVLKIIKGGKNPDSEKHIDAIWTVAYSALWNNRTFTRKETDQFKKLIADHFNNGKKAKTTFKELVERICLAKRFVARGKGRYISKPIDWLNINYHNGLAKTAVWLEKTNEQRKTCPEYNKGITTLAKGLLKFSETESMAVFYRYRRLLMEQKQHDLLQILYNAVLNLQYFN